MAASKISVYSLPDLKNTTDDTLPNFLTSLNFRQSHFLTDVRLVLGYSAAALGAITFYLDYNMGWDDTKDFTFYAVIAYFVLNTALTIWIWGVERGKIFSGDFENTMITIASSVTKHTPTYKLKIRTNHLTKSKPYGWDEKEISAPFMKWFSADGDFIAKPFQNWLASEIEIIREADQKRSGRKSSSDMEDSVVLQRVLKADSTTARFASDRSGPGTSTKARKGKK